MLELAERTESRCGRESPRTLLIEDDPVDARLLVRQLQSVAARPHSVIRARDLAEGLRIARTSNLDLVLLDLSLPDARGVESVKRVLDACPEVPVVVLTGCDDEGAAIEAMRLGAQDYLVKGEFHSAWLAKSISFARERHHLQQQLDRARRRESEVKDEFLSHVSHELRTPLTAIVQFAAILRDGIAGDPNDEQRRFLEIILRNSDQLKKMIGSLMDVTRAGSGKLTCQLERVVAEDLVRGVVEAQSEEGRCKGIVLRYQVEGTPQVIADPGRITQVLTNFVTNAFKFSPEGSSVEVTVADDPKRRGHVRFSVADQGCGMSPDELDRVFDRLFQSKSGENVSRKGLGLGLYISREIARLHDGYIWAESTLDRGSTFHISLPAFALEERVRRIALPDGEPAEAVSLIELTVAATGAASRAKGLSSVLPTATRILESCMLGVSDALLPICEVDPHRQQVFALARTGSEGAEVIVKRVESELARDERLGLLGFESSVACHTFALPENEADMDLAIGEIAQRVEAKLQGRDEGRS